MHRPRTERFCRTQRLPRARSRGSLLLVSMLIAVVIGVSLTTYLKLAMSSANLANRSFYHSSAINLAEIGVEEALYCFNRLDNVSSASAAWTGTGVTWTIAGSSVTGTIGPLTLGAGVNGNVKVYCDRYDTSAPNPVIVARAIVSMPQGQPLEKWLKITLRKRSLFANGLVARNDITWNGNVMADSWNSTYNDDGTLRASPVGYASTYQRANCTVGSDDGNIALGTNGNVYGYTKTDGTHTSTGGSVHGLGTTTNDPSRRTQDFSATFPEVTVPSPSYTNLISASPGGGTSFPRSGDATASDSKYYYNFAGGTNINLTGSNTITIAGNCVFIFANHAGVDTIRTAGNGRILINSSASLVVYTNGNISNSGNGFMNNNTTPSSCIIYGTNPSTASQSVTMNGNGSGGAAFYMPNATFSVVGNGEVRGAVVAHSISMNGNASFHYDEALGNLGGGNPYGVQEWRELQSSTERATYASLLNF